MADLPPIIAAAAATNTIVSRSRCRRRRRFGARRRAALDQDEGELDRPEVLDGDDHVVDYGDVLAVVGQQPCTNNQPFR